MAVLPTLKDPIARPRWRTNIRRYHLLRLMPRLTGNQGAIEPGSGGTCREPGPKAVSAERLSTETNYRGPFLNDPGNSAVIQALRSPQRTKDRTGGDARLCQPIVQCRLGI